MNGNLKTKQSGFFLALGTALLSSLLMVACGGGSGGGGGGGSAATPVTSSGAITAKGSIFVNGVEFETEGAQLEMENEAPRTIGLDDSILRRGMIVEVEGEVNDDGRTGRATRIRFEDNIEGPIASVTSTSPLVKTLVILGQTVIVEDGVTAFDNSSAGLRAFDELDAGDVGAVVEVSGFPRADGAVVATFIEKKANDLASFVGAGEFLEVKGVVKNHDPVGRTFEIGSLTVNYTGVVTGLANGVTVEVKGNSFAGAALVASVEIENEGLDDAVKAEVEGIVSGLNTGARTFTVNGQLVSYAIAAFVGGVEADLADGARVEAEGPIVGGTLNAVKVVFRESVRFEGNIASFAGGVLTLEGFPTISIVVDEAVARFRAGQSTADLTAGKEVKVRARQSGSNLVATRIEVVNAAPAQTTSIQGPVTAISGNTLTILGIGIDTSTIANTDDSTGESNFEIEDAPVSRAAFLAALGVGDIVKAKARISAGNLTWKEIEIEMED